MFDSVTWLITRKCEINCKCCNFRDSKIKEASTDEKLKAVRVLKGWDNPALFTCLLGGDVLCIKDLKDFLWRMNLTPALKYAFQTSASNYKRMEMVIRSIPNLSISVDPADFTDYDRCLRSYKGIFWAGYSRGVGSVQVDLHATMTLDRNNVRFAPAVVRLLSDLKIWSELTLVHWKKDNFDLVPSRRDALGFLPGDKNLLQEVSEELIEMKQEGYLVHSSERFLRDWSVHGVELDWKCDAPVNCVIDSDLSMRMCLHVPGGRVRKWSILDLADKQESWPNFLKDWQADQDEYCPKCFWDCQYELIRGNREFNDNWFSHKG